MPWSSYTCARASSIPISLLAMHREKGAKMDTLVSTDRCDRCGAQAYVRVNKNVSTLDFCGHHFTKLGDLLDKDGWSVSIDTRELLNNRAVGAEVR